jgi:ketosteroid isomerase-like protein
MVEEGDTVMAELRGWAPQQSGEPVRMSMAEVFVIRAGKIAERRAWVIPLSENEYR